MARAAASAAVVGIRLIKHVGKSVKNLCEEGSAVVSVIDRVIIAIGKAIESKEVLSRGEVRVCVNESAGGRVVVAALEVVQLGFRIVVIASVAQGVYEGNVTRVRNGCTGSVGDAQELAVSIVAVVCEGLFLRIGDSYDVALQVRDEVVKRDCTVYCTGACPPSGRPYWAGLCLFTTNRLPKAPGGGQRHARPSHSCADNERT